MFKSRPTINGEAVASLTTCSTNLHSSSEFQTASQFVRFMQEWRRSGPKSCRRKATKPEELMGFVADRLGINGEHLCDNL